MKILIRLAVQSVMFVATFIGIFHLPKDIGESGDAARSWLNLAYLIPTQNAALWIAATGLAAWILIKDLLPWWRDRKRWWSGLHCFSLRNVGCMIAGVSDNDFDTSARAKAIADEYRAYIDRGHMPLFFDDKDITWEAGRFGLVGPYGRKNVDYRAIIARKDVEDLARARGWRLPWTIPPKAETPQKIELQPRDLSAAMRLATISLDQVVNRQ